MDQLAHVTAPTRAKIIEFMESNHISKLNDISKDQMKALIDMIKPKCADGCNHTLTSGNVYDGQRDCGLKKPGCLLKTPPAYRVGYHYN